MTTTYSSDTDILNHYADAKRLLQTSDAESFERPRVTIYNMINVALDSRNPRQAGVVGAQRFIELEVAGVLALLMRENKVSGKDDLYESQTKFWQGQYDYLIENVRTAIVGDDEEDIDEYQTFGMSIPCSRG